MVGLMFARTKILLEDEQLQYSREGPGSQALYHLRL